MTRFLLLPLFVLALIFATSMPAWSDDASDDAPPPETTEADADDDGEDESTDGDEEEESESSSEDRNKTVVFPLVILVIGIAIVLGLIIVLKVNAFIALITAAIAVSLMAVGMLGEGSWSGAIGRVASAFGSTVGGIGIVIALAAVIGKCMLDSGAADRIVRAFMKVLGVKGSPVALMGSGFVLSVPVFFDTVFYLLVPLARSLHRSTKKNYLMYIMAIGAGGAITHTLVPPTPGPLMMANNLGFDVGIMIIVGALIALPAAIAGLIFAVVVDRIMKTPMRPIPGQEEPDPLKDDELPGLLISLAPVLLPVLLIGANTVMTTIADNQHAALLTVEDVEDDDWPAFRASLAETTDDNDAADPADSANLVSQRIQTLIEGEKSDDGEAPEDAERRARVNDLIAEQEQLTADEKQEVIDGLNDYVLESKDKFYEGGLGEDEAFVCVYLNDTARSKLSDRGVRTKQSVHERINRSVLESAYPQVQDHEWNTPVRKASEFTSLFGNANFALLLSTVIALGLVVKQRGLSKKELAGIVETSLMSGGVIILITAGGGAFGAMLKEAQIGGAIETLFGEQLSGASAGTMIIVLAFLLGTLLKIAQGSGTVSMIVGTSMMAAIVAGMTLPFHPVYIATAVGAGSLCGSWMNDSGFWIFAKMGGLTEGEALKSWTLMLVVLGLVSFGVTLLLSQVLPLTNFQ